MASGGEMIREMREQLGVTQANLASMIGTTQQTIDRIESGETKRSRYIDLAQQALNYVSFMRNRAAADGEEYGAPRVLAPMDSTALTSQFVSTFILRSDGMLEAVSQRTQIHFPFNPASERAPYAVILSKAIQGPDGWAFRARDTVIIDPSDPPKHLDWAMVAPQGEAAKLVCLIDPSEAISVLSDEEIAQKGYAPLSSEPFVQQRVVARYMA